MDAKKLFMLMAGGVAVLILGIGYGLYWGNSKLQVKSNEISQLNQEDASLEQQIANAQRLKSDLEDYEDIHAIIDQVLPPTKTQENIVGELISIASDRNVQLQGISFAGGAGSSLDPNLTQTAQVEGAAGVFSIAMGTSFESNYQTVLDFLKDLETNKRRFEVVNVSISPSTTPSGSVIYGVQLNLLTYVKP